VCTFKCIIKKDKCPVTGRCNLRLTEVAEVGRVGRIFNRIFGGRGKSQLKDNTSTPVGVIAVDAKRSALLKLQRPWREIVEDNKGIKLAFCDDTFDMDEIRRDIPAL